MPLTDEQRAIIGSFRSYIEDSVSTDDRYGTKARHDRPDETILASRFEAAPKCWFEVAVRPMIPQVRVGFLTSDRWISEGAEEAIESSGDTMSEFVESGFDDAGLDYQNPTVEHFREAGEFFYFATPLELDELTDLDREAFRNTALRMLEGYLIAFGPALVVEDEE